MNKDMRSDAEVAETGSGDHLEPGSGSVARNRDAMKGKATDSGYKVSILQSLRRITRAVGIYSRKLAANYQVTGPQLVCLISICDGEPATASTIARKVHLSASTVVGILTRLEEKGLIVRHRSELDRRQVNIIPTERGKELARNAPSPLQDKLSQALDGLNELEQATIALSLSRIVALMEAPHYDAAPILHSSDKLDDEFDLKDTLTGEEIY